MTVLTRRISLLLLGTLLSVTASAAQRPYLVDGDADAVSDEIDECPYTQPGIQVDRKGCPKRIDDGDLDGVPDDADDCPYSAVGAVVDQKGCALDSDFDGVANGIDRCPRTLLTLPVNDTGCAVGERAVATAPSASPAKIALQAPATVIATSKPVLAPAPVVVDMTPKAATAPPARVEAASKPAPTAVPATKAAASVEAPLLQVNFIANGGLLSESDRAKIHVYARVFQRRLASEPAAQLQLQAFADAGESDPTGSSAARLLVVRSALLAEGIAAARIKSSAGVLHDGDAARNRRVEVRFSN